MIETISLAETTLRNQEILQENIFKTNIERLLSIHLEKISGEKHQISLTLEPIINQEFWQSQFYAEQFFENFMDNHGLVATFRLSLLDNSQLMDFYHKFEMEAF